MEIKDILLAEYKIEKDNKVTRPTSYIPKTKGHNEYYLSVASSLWLAVRFGMKHLLARGGGETGSLFDLDDSKMVIGVSQSVLDSRTKLNPTRKKSPAGLYREHIVPCKLIVDEAIDIYQRDATPGEIQPDDPKRILKVAKLIRDNLFIVLITKEEAGILDKTLDLQTTMPSGWKFGDDVFARLKAAKDLTDSQGNSMEIPVYNIRNTTERIA